MPKHTILVTGGAGFIGSHVVDAYITRGYRVVVIDNLLTGLRRNLNPKAVFYNADIRNQKLITRICKKERPSVINHHAALAEVIRSLKDPLPTLETNVLGTAALLTAGAQNGMKRFLFASTGGAIYGAPNTLPARETAPPVPLSPYALSKLLGEETIHCYAKLFGFTYLIFRYSNIYGPRQIVKGEAGVVPIFAGMMLRGLRPTIYGDGTKTRDYTYVGDIARANVLGVRRGNNETVNLGWGKEVSDQDIFNHVARTLNFSKPPIYKPFRKGEVYQIALSAKKARRVLGWKPTISLREGIRLAVTSPS